MLNNFMDPAILFFLFGVLAGLAKSNLEIPQPISKFLSLYLLMALGLKGGFALSQSGLTLDVAKGLGAAILLAVAIPLIGYQILKRLTGPFDAAAIAATYGSVSAVTFITSVQFLDNQQIPYSGHMSAAMAVMESPAILLAVFWVNALRSKANTSSNGQHGLKQTLHESLTDGAQLLLLGAMAVGGVFIALAARRSPEGSLADRTPTNVYAVTGGVNLQPLQRLGDVGQLGRELGDVDVEPDPEQDAVAASGHAAVVGRLARQPVQLRQDPGDLAVRAVGPHAAGDQVLLTTTERFVNVVRASDSAEMSMVN